MSKFFAEIHLLLDPQSEGHDEIRHDIELRETGIRKYDNGGKKIWKKIETRNFLSVVETFLRMIKRL